MLKAKLTINLEFVLVALGLYFPALNPNLCFLAMTLNLLFKAPACNGTLSSQSIQTAFKQHKKRRKEKSQSFSCFIYHIV